MLPLAITIISAITHFIFYGHPSSVAFDEVHIGYAMTHYWSGSYFFYVHPPFAQILYAVVGFMTGAATQHLDWTNIGNHLSPEAIAIRLIPMTMGTLLSPMLYWIARRLNMSKVAAALIALSLSFENLLIVQSRFVIADMVMIFFGFLALATYLEARHRSNRGGFRITLLSLSAICCALAGSVKWTGLSFPLLIFLFEFFNLRGSIRARLFGSRLWKMFALYAGIFLALYTLFFVMHFALLPHSGEGNAFMSPYFQKTLTDNAYANDPTIHPQGFLRKYIELNYRMFDVTAHLYQPHDYSSKWYTWPFMIRPVFYWQTTPPTQGGPNEYIYLLGNPLLFWGGTFSVLLLCFVVWRRLRRKIRLDHALFFIFVGFLINYLPFIFIGRVMFIYHYETALVFSIMAIGYLFDLIPSEGKKKVLAVSVFLLVVFVVYLYFSPLTYGTILSDDQIASKMWLHSWR